MKGHDLGSFLTNQKIVGLLSSAEVRALSSTWRLRGQGQGLQNVSSRLRTFLRTPRLIYKVTKKKTFHTAFENVCCKLRAENGGRG